MDPLAPTVKKQPACKFSNKRIFHVHKFKKHYLTHTCNEHEPFKCNVCQKTFSTQAIQHAHIVKKQPGCKLCDKIVFHTSNNERHYLTHTCNKPFKCHVCQKSFSTLSVWHMLRLTRTGYKPFQCQICKKIFLKISSLIEHIRTHRDYQCDLCPKKFSKKYLLDVHYLTHDVKPFTWYVCDSPVSYKCDVCQEEFFLRSNLREHELTHRFESVHRHKCVVCKKQFATEFELHLHKISHIVKCKVCTKRFIEAATLSEPDLFARARADVEAEIGRQLEF